MSIPGEQSYLRDDARRAAVVPRVRVTPGGATLPLETHVRRMLDAGMRGTVLLVGGPGSGKTTALAHLRAVLPPSAPVELLDVPPLDELLAAGRERLAVAAVAHEIPGDWIVKLELSTWRPDDWIEYLV